MRSGSPFLDCKLLHVAICNCTIMSCLGRQNTTIFSLWGRLSFVSLRSLPFSHPLYCVFFLLLYEYAFSMLALRRMLCKYWIQAFSILTRVSASGCYYSANDTILPSPDYVAPCGTLITPDTINCCVIQSGNVCLSNSICYIPFSNTYYLSPCTDPTYSAPECLSYCGACVFGVSQRSFVSTNWTKVIAQTSMN